MKDHIDLNQWSSDIPKKPGIYAIRSKSHDRFYVGSSISLRDRKHTHSRKLLNNEHENAKLQRHLNKYGQDDLTFQILEIIDDKKLLLEREQYWIDFYKPYFNIKRKAGALYNHKWKKTAIETRRANRQKKIDETGIDPRAFDDESIRRMSVSQRLRNPIPNKVGHFTVTCFIGVRNKQSYVMAQCPYCGNEREYNLNLLKKKKRKHCGCIKCMLKPIPSIPRSFHSQRTVSTKQYQNSTGYVGIRTVQQKKCVKYRAVITINGKTHSIKGYYLSVKEAVTARDKYIIDNNLNYETQLLTIGSS